MELRMLVGSRVVSWGPEYDYYRLVLDRARLTLYNPVFVTGGDLLGSTVTGVELEKGVEFRLLFDCSAQVRMSLRDEDYVGPEAGTIGFPDGTIGIIT